MFDAQEYLHLAIHASNKNDPHAAMEYLKQALIEAPDLAPAHYLLAAQYAEIGLFDRAIAGMEKAIALDPNIEMAKFQLSLLYMRQNLDPQKAESLLNSLIVSSNDESLRYFSEGLVALLQDKLEIAKQKIAVGLTIVNNNPALKNDMQNLLNNLLEKMPSEGGFDQSGTEPTSAGAYLGAYQQHSANDE